MDCANVEYYEHVATIAAIVGGGGLFIWKIATGWLIANFDVSIDLQRQSKDNQTDYLKVEIHLNKGSIDSIVLTEVSFRVFDIEYKAISEPEKIEEIQRRELTGEGSIDWDGSLSETSFSISTDETFKYTRIVTVPVEKPVIVEACVRGRRLFWRKAQWRTSAAALPVDRSVKA